MDKTQTIIGFVADGIEVIDKLNAFPVDAKTQRPITNIRVLATTVFDDPFPEEDPNFKDPDSAAEISSVGSKDA